MHAKGTDENEKDETLQKPSLLVNAPRARKEGGGGRRKKEKEGEKEAKVFPATAQASKDTPKRKGSQL